ncbi:MAG: hypothetical protein RR499_03325, partial [Mucinivorans sp.]
LRAPNPRPHKWHLIAVNNEIKTSRTKTSITYQDTITITMNKIFILNNNNIQSILQLTQQLQLDKHNTFIGNSFDTFAKNLNPGDTALVYSLNCFNSITQILDRKTKLQQQNITLQSIKEPWFNNPNISNTELLKNLLELGTNIHKPTR